MYLWTNLTNSGKVLKVGTEVSQESLGVSDEEWEQLKESRVVRESKFLELPPNWLGSPKEYRDHLLRQQMDELDDALDEHFELDPGEEAVTADELSATGV